MPPLEKPLQYFLHLKHIILTSRGIPDIVGSLIVQPYPSEPHGEYRSKQVIMMLTMDGVPRPLLSDPHNHRGSLFQVLGLALPTGLNVVCR